MPKTYSDEIELARSDMGDGGWSLHAHRTDIVEDDDHDAQDVWPILCCGESGASESGSWLRPDEADYEQARQRLATLRA